MKPFVPSLLFSVASTAALPQYADKIPNGYSVPNPEPQGGVWAGVGHVNAAGGGERNAFGEDFAANGHEWTMELCETDSDGDGRSNGEELGDPSCIWVQGEEPAGPALSHPGIVDEPIDASSASVSDHCDDYVAPDDQITMDIVFSVPTQMDESQTHYICEQQGMEVPAKQVLHKIKHGVILDNSNVLHHMFVFVCPRGTESTDGNKVGEGPYECSGNESRCRRIGGWAIGPHEKCNPPNVGNELDFSEMDSVIVKIEAHYDNTMGQPQQDQSGIRLYMTPTLRPLKGGELMTGIAAGGAYADADFMIPAQQTSYSMSGLCPTAITENMEHPVYVYAYTPHMHLYGRTMITEHYRCGQKIGEFGSINGYEFDNQQSYTLNPPVKILPGDALVTTCIYDSSQSEFDIFGGEETSNEMCVNFFSVYPTPGTDEIPTLLSPCMSVENGMIVSDNVIPARAAFGDRDRLTLTRNFVSEPEQNVGACCQTNNCHEMYLAVVNQACGLDSDCVSPLVCAGGLCNHPPENPLSVEDTSVATPFCKAPVGLVSSVVALLLLHAM